MPTDRAAPETATRKAGWPDRGTAADAAEFAEGLATVARAGLPLPAGLRALGAEASSRRLGRLLGATADRVERGDATADALAGLVGRYPPALRGLIVAGAGSGRLADVLARYAAYASLGADLRRRFWAVVAYPLFLLAALGGLYLFVFAWVVESFRNLMADFGVERPAITSLLFAFADMTRAHGTTILAGAGGLAVVGLVAARVALGPVERRWLVTGIPLVGPVLRSSSLAEFCHLAGLLVEAETPLPRALELAGLGSGDAELAGAGIDLRRSVELGRTLDGALGRWPRCPAGLVEVIAGSEGRGDLAPALHLAGAMFEARTRAQAAFASSVFAAGTLVLLLLGIGFVLFALYLPVSRLIWKLI